MTADERADRIAADAVELYTNAEIAELSRKITAAIWAAEAAMKERCIAAIQAKRDELDDIEESNEDVEETVSGLISREKDTFDEAIVAIRSL